jgi:hypothetical protein
LTRTQRQIEEHRKADATIGRLDATGQPCPGVPVWAEQEAHEFRFGCVMPDLSGFSEPDRQRCRARLVELFNSFQPGGGEVLAVVVPEGIHLGRLRRQLDRAPAAARPLEVHVDGRAVGLAASAEGEERAGHRLAELYTLCFAHPAVGGVFWHGLVDDEEPGGGGLLRRDLSPRPAYRYLHKLIDLIWHSRASGVTDAAGLFSFRGFFGDYRIAARPSEQPATVAHFSLRHGAARSTTLVVQ